MNKSIAILLITLSTSAFSQTKLIPCEELSFQFKEFINSEIKTFSSINKYLKDNATNWSRIDQAMKMMIDNRRARRRYSYTGNATTESRKSLENERRMRHHQDKIGDFSDIFIESMDACL